MFSENVENGKLPARHLGLGLKRAWSGVVSQNSLLGNNSSTPLIAVGFTRHLLCSLY